MTDFRDYYYYLKSIRWILNNSLANTTIGSSSLSTIPSNIQKEKHLAKEEIENATILDLEKW